MKENYHVPSLPYFISNKKGCTKYEEKFFKATDHFNISLDIESSECSLDNMMHKINQAYHSFKKEIIENSTLFNTVQRTRYLNRLLLMLNDIHDTWISPEIAKEEPQPNDIQLLINGVNLSLTFQFESCFHVIAENKKNIQELIQNLIGCKPVFIVPARGRTVLSSCALNPIFDPRYIPVILEIFKGFFSHEHWIMLERLLKTSENSTEPLIFLANGNQWADSMKQLYNVRVITGCEKQELQRWICRNFKYRFRQKINDFTLHYLNKLISANDDICHHPIINVYRERETDMFLIKRI